jgi:hypothetical protein
LQVPVPLVIVTLVPLIEQAPVAVMDGVIGALDVAFTVKLDPYSALGGAPVKVTVCGALVACVICLTVGAAR